MYSCICPFIDQSIIFSKLFLFLRSTAILSYREKIQENGMIKTTRRAEYRLSPIYNHIIAHIEINRLVRIAAKLTDFFMSGKLVLNGLKKATVD